MKCLCLPDQETGTATVVDHVRLFRNDPRIRWKYRIHEQILSAVKMAGGEARWSDVVIHHVGYQDRARLRPKLERDVRLLRMDLADDPEEPFTLFNLGWTLLKQGRPAEGMPHLERSLARSQPGDSIVRKIYALIIECHIRLGNVGRALEVCGQGRRVCPDDAEILFEEGTLHLDQGNLAAAEANFIALLERRAGTYFASVDPALSGYKSRHSLGSVYQKQGRLVQAERQWQKALAERADYTPTLLALGELYLEQGQWTKLEAMIAGLERVPGAKVESAVLRAKAHMARREFGAAKDLLEDAKQRFPKSLLPRVVLAHALLQEDRDVEGAEQALREVLAMDPHHGPTQHNLRVLMSKRGGTAPNPAAEAEAHFVRGTELATQGRRTEAIPEFREAIRLVPEHPRAHFNLGVALGIDKKHEEALACFQDAIRCQPDFAEAHYGLGNALIELGRIEEAVAAFQCAVLKKPDFVDALNNLGMTLTRLGRGGAAEVFVRQALRLRPEAPETHNTLGLAYMEQGEFKLGQACFEKALDLNPRYAEAHTNLGSSYKEAGRPAEAVACYDLALALESESVTAHWNRSLALLQVGNYEHGWREYEWRWKRKETKPRPFKQPQWDGSPLGGRSILLHMEQGFGDMLQFIRYVPMVKLKGGSVVVAAPPTLVGLFGTCGAEKVVPENQELPACDLHCPIMSVPGLLGTTATTIPTNVPYLTAEPAKVEHWRQRLGGLSGVKVGVVWQGNPRHKLDRHRSFPLTLLEPLARIKNVSLVSIQKGAGSEQVELLRDRFAVMDVGADLTDFTDTAAVMKCLDLVVCCDTSVAHLAGALGVRVWVALATVADWRWLLGRDDSPWYPTMRLFRQDRLGEWRPVFRWIAAAVDKVFAQIANEALPSTF